MPVGIARLITSLQPFAVEDRYPLLMLREVPRDEVHALLPLVAAEVESLDAALLRGGSLEG